MSAAWITGSMPRVATLPWPGIPGAFLCLSGRLREGQHAYGTKWYAKGEQHNERTEKYIDDEVRTTPVISFIFDTGNCCAEWDGEYGPIQLAWKRDAGFKAGDTEAESHWFYPYATWRGHWSQMAVKEARLSELFNAGRYEEIFHELRRWATRNDPTEEA